MAQKSDRMSELRKYIHKGELGIEIAPYCRPIAPRNDGYQTIVMDVYDTETIRKRASQDSTIEAEKISLIEDVDVVGDASDIAALTKLARNDQPISYVVSSHNYEHLPNPVNPSSGTLRSFRKTACWVDHYGLTRLLRSLPISCTFFGLLRRLSFII
ncbi:hypothetical protein [uncultured Roseobacter sp.]|uniref:hypothetical protein n=1 Tax=uncultured Roseobacter sp. TaxID=114847 RepID=UPI00262F1D5A|nr:hypothetical protein [uncultured Roseobacter sp.]